MKHLRFVALTSWQPDEQSFKNDLLAGVNEFSRSGIAEKRKWIEFAAKLIYVQGDFQESGTFSNLKEKSG
jgi:glucose-6-phosphate 1-dehydrogenase